MPMTARSLLLSIPLALGISVVAAQVPTPDLTGTWVGMSHSIIFGNFYGHHADSTKPAHKPFVAAREFTMVVEGQDERRFWGTMVSANMRESFIGVMRADVRRMILVDGDGTMEAEFLTPASFELCYSQDGAAAGKMQIASCTVFNKR
jgi:hypothetical protein